MPASPDRRYRGAIIGLGGIGAAIGAAACGQRPVVDLSTGSFIFQAFALLDPKNALAPNTVRWLMNARKKGRWGNTQENAWAMAAGRLFMIGVPTPLGMGTGVLTRQALACGPAHPLKDYGQNDEGD